MGGWNIRVNAPYSLCHHNFESEFTNVLVPFYHSIVNPFSVLNDATFPANYLCTTAFSGKRDGPQMAKKHPEILSG